MDLALEQVILWFSIGSKRFNYGNSNLESLIILKSLAFSRIGN